MTFATEQEFLGKAPKYNGDIKLPIYLDFLLNILQLVFIFFSLEGKKVQPLVVAGTLMFRIGDDQ